MSDYGKKQYYIACVSLVLTIIGLWYADKSLNLQKQDSKAKGDVVETPKIQPSIPKDTTSNNNYGSTDLKPTDPRSESQPKFPQLTKDQDSKVNYDNKQLNLNIGSNSVKEIHKIIDDSGNNIHIPSKSNNGNISLILNSKCKSVIIYFNNGSNETYDTN